MRISKEKAQHIADQVTKPLELKIKHAIAELNTKGKEIVESTIPLEVLKCFKKHPSTFRTQSSVYFRGVGISNRIDISFGCSLPLANYEFSASSAQAKEVAALFSKVEDATKKLEETNLSIYNTILGLGTYNRIREHLPEVDKFLPTENNNVIALPTKGIRDQIKALTA